MYFRNNQKEIGQNKIDYIKLLDIINSGNHGKL